MNAQFEELTTLIRHTMAHVMSHPGKQIPGSPETIAFFSKHKPVFVPEKKSEPKQKKHAVIAPPITPPATPIQPLIKKQEATPLPQPAAPIPQQDSLLELTLSIAARPVTFETKPLVQERNTRQVDFPWSTTYPQVITISQAPDCFEPFIQNVTTAINDNIARSKLLTDMNPSKWVELITLSSTNLLKSVIFFVDKLHERPCMPINGYLIQKNIHPPAPLHYLGTLFTTNLYEAAVDHDLPESKARKVTLWKALTSMLRSS